MILYFCIFKIIDNLMGKTGWNLLLDDGKIVEMGVSVFDVKATPVQKIPYTSPYYIISICHSGSLEAEYDSVKVQFHPHDLAIVYPQHTLLVQRVSSDYHATMIVVSAGLYAKIGKLVLDDKRSVYERFPHFHLDGSQYVDMVVFADAIRRIMCLNLKSREDISRGCLYLLSQIVNFFHDVTVTSSQSLSNRFYNAIIENCHLHRDVQFYAKLFYLTPKHFSKVILQQTGHAAGYWIRHFVILHAKQMLLYEHDVSVQVVADRLGFPDQASFCRYFKRGMGISPKQFRSIT